MTEYGICAKCKKSVGCSYADDRITGCKNFVLEPELKLTNKEWFCQLPTEEKAKRIINIAVNSNCDYETIVKWLKQPHAARKQNEN